MPKCKECVRYKDCAPCVSPEDEAGCGAYRSIKDEINTEVSNVISDIRKRIHDRAVHGYGPVSGYVLTKEIDAILNEYKEKYSRKVTKENVREECKRGGQGDPRGGSEIVDDRGSK